MTHPVVPNLPILGGAMNIFEGGFLTDPVWLSSNVTESLFEPWDTSDSNCNIVIDDKYKCPKQIQVINLHSANNTEIISRSLEEVYTEVTAGLGIDVKYKAFQGEMEAAFSTSHGSTSSRWFCIFRYQRSYFSLRLSANLDDLKSRLTDHARHAINSGDPYELFRNHGTHFIHELIYGGALAIDMSIDDTYTEDVTVATATVYGEFDAKLGHVAMSSNIDVESSEVTEHFESVSNIKQFGAAPPSVNDDNSINAFSKGYFDAVKENPVPIQPSKDGLMGIWELADSDARKVELKNAFENYAENKDAVLDSPVIYGFYTICYKDQAAKKPTNKTFIVPEGLDFGDHRTKTKLAYGQSKNPMSHPNPPWEWPAASLMLCSNNITDWNRGVSIFEFEGQNYRLVGGRCVSAGENYYEWGSSKNTYAPAITMFRSANPKDYSHTVGMAVHLHFRKYEDMNEGDEYFEFLGALDVSENHTSRVGSDNGHHQLICHNHLTYSSSKHKFEYGDLYLTLRKKKFK
ncbi:MAC/perforin domain-containing protein [Microbulbifer sp. TYP-18]|uniref:MAC/perforin domain-containing protein n=1 Tax=Microbulbifer sp. TYP-18 TaxID=3230024 RepID=UPI0034C68147